MGTRADFYAGRGEQAEWLGSTAWDGDPSSVFEGSELMLDKAVTLSEADWRAWVTKHLATEEDSTTPDRGWPWPWDDSETTDCVYAWDAGKIWQAAGYPRARWYPVDPEDEYYGLPEDEDDATGEFAVWPNMAVRKRVAVGQRSGLLVFEVRRAP